MKDRRLGREEDHVLPNDSFGFEARIVQPGAQDRVDDMTVTFRRLERPREVVGLREGSTVSHLS